MSEQQTYATGFLPCYITLHKFITWNRDQPQTIPFTGNLIAISGVNGAGKSLIIDGMTFAIYGKTFRSGFKIKDVLGKNGFVKFGFEKNEHFWEIERRRGTKDDMYLKIFCDGDEFNGKITEVTERILTVMGMSFSTFTSTILIGQSDDNLTSMTPVPRAVLLKQIFNLTLLENALTHIKDDLKQMKVDHQIKLQERDTLKRIQVSRDSLELQKDTLEQESKNNLLKAQEFFKTIENLDHELDDLQLVRETYMKIQQEINTCKNTIILESNKAKRLQLPILNQSIQETAIKLPEYEKIMEQLNETKQTLYGLTERIKMFQNQYNSIEKEKSDMLCKYQNFIQMKPNEIETTAIEILSKYKENNISINETLHQLEPIVLTNYVVSLSQSYDSKLIDIKTQMQNIQLKIKEVQTQNETILKYTNDSLKQLILKAKQAEREVNEFEHKLSIYTTAKHECEEIIDQQQHLFQELNTKLLTMDYDEERYTEVKQDKIEFERLYNEFKTIIASNQAKIEMIDSQIEKSIEIENQILDLEQIIQDQISQIRDQDNLQKIFETFQIHALNYYLESLSHDATDLIVKMTAHRLDIDGKGQSRRYSSIMFTSKKNGIELTIDGRDISSFSGGERAIIGLCIRIAIASLLSGMNDFSSTRSLIIDEANIGYMDVDNAHTLIDTLSSASNLFDRIIIITHIMGLTDNFDQHLEVSPEGGSHILS